MEEVKKLALLLASKAPFAIKAAKNSINFAGDANSQLGMLLEQKMGSLLFATQDQKEGMKAFIEKRQPVFQGK
jgi:enoyl-CoA hydratase/carnithine racemase